MQKALVQMNVHLQHVLADLTGATGMRIIRAILAGERDPHRLAALRDPSCKQPEAIIAKALQGDWRVEHLFALPRCNVGPGRDLPGPDRGLRCLYRGPAADLRRSQRRRPAAQVA